MNVAQDNSHIFPDCKVFLSQLLSHNSFRSGMNQYCPNELLPQRQPGYAMSAIAFTHRQLSQIQCNAQRSYNNIVMTRTQKHYYNPAAATVIAYYKKLHTNRYSFISLTVIY